MKKITKYVLESTLKTKWKKECEKTKDWNEKAKNLDGLDYDLIDEKEVEKLTSLVLKDVSKSELKIEDISLSCYNKDNRFIRYELYMSLEIITRDPNKIGLFLNKITLDKWSVTKQNMNSYWFTASIHTFRPKH